MIIVHQPEYPGGFMAMQEFLAKNMKYPREARIRREEER